MYENMTYIEKLNMWYEIMFGYKPTTRVYSHLDKELHPELHTSDILNSDAIKMYQYLILSFQGTVYLGRFNIATDTF